MYNIDTQHNHCDKCQAEILDEICENTVKLNSANFVMCKKCYGEFITKFWNWCSEGKINA